MTLLDWSICCSGQDTLGTRASENKKWENNEEDPAQNCFKTTQRIGWYQYPRWSRRGRSTYCTCWLLICLHHPIRFMIRWLPALSVKYVPVHRSSFHLLWFSELALILSISVHNCILKWLVLCWTIGDEMACTRVPLFVSITCVSFWSKKIKKTCVLNMNN